MGEDATPGLPHLRTGEDNTLPFEVGIGGFDILDRDRGTCEAPDKLSILLFGAIIDSFDNQFCVEIKAVCRFFPFSFYRKLEDRPVKTACSGQIVNENPKGLKTHLPLLNRTQNPARRHNDVSIDLMPRNSLIVETGRSGTGSKGRRYPPSSSPPSPPPPLLPPVSLLLVGVPE